jgi:hypothetical protein
VESTDDSIECADMYTYEGKLNIYRERLKLHIRREVDFKKERNFATEIVLRQCSQDMKDKLKARKRYEKIVRNSDMLALLKEVRTCSLDCSDEGYVVFNATYAAKAVWTCYQQRDEGDHQYKERMDAAVLQLEQLGGDIARLFRFKWGDEFASLTKKEKKEHLCAVLLIENACRVRYGGLKKLLKQQAIGGLNTYPKTCSEALTRMSNYEPDDIAPPSVRDDGATPSSFAQSGQKAPDGLDLVAGADGKTHASIPCRYCKRYGHYKNQCTDGIRMKPPPSLIYSPPKDSSPSRQMAACSTVTRRECSQA